MPLTVETLLKATPKVEGGQRLIYCEPSNETTDMEGERVLRKALEESREYFLAKGNFDIDHLSLTGYARGIANPRAYEIGRPVEVKLDSRIFVKGYIYSGDGHEHANFFWQSLTDYVPPMPWFPSVGGHVRDAGTILPKDEQVPVKAIKQVYWNNIGFSREPVNLTVPGVSVMPIGAFAKSWIGDGSALIYKTVEAGYGTDHAALEGGGAMRHESLDTKLHSVWSRLFTKVKAGELAITKDPQSLLTYLMDAEGMDHDEAVQALRYYAARRRSSHPPSKEFAHV